MPARNLNERKSLKADPDVGFDQKGYIVTNGDEDEIKKTQAATDRVLGVVYTSSLDEEDREVLTGRHMPVIHDGYPLTLVEAGTDVTGGDPLYVSDSTPGVATTTEATDAAKVGNVVPGADKALSEEDGPTLVQVDVTSNLGDS